MTSTSTPTTRAVCAVARFRLVAWSLVVGAAPRLRRAPQGAAADAGAGAARPGARSRAGTRASMPSRNTPPIPTRSSRRCTASRSRSSRRPTARSRARGSASPKTTRAGIILGANEQQPFTRLTLDKAGKVARPRRSSRRCPSRWASRGTTTASTCRAAGSRSPSRKTMRIRDSARQSGQAGLHRLRDPKGDGSFTTVDTLRTWDGGEGGHSDHGIHEARVSPDGKHFYIINGNGVVPPEDVSPNSPLRNYADDRIIPLLGTQTGRLGQEKAPGGIIARTDLRRQGPPSVRRRHAQRPALRLERRRRDLLVRQRHGAGVRRALVPAGARVLDAERRRSGLPRQQRQVPDLVRGLAAAAGRDRTRQSGRRDVRLPHGLPAQPIRRALFVADNNYGRIIAVHLKPVGQRLRRDVVGELHLAEVALRRDAADAAQRHRHDRVAATARSTTSSATAAPSRIS